MTNRRVAVLVAFAVVVIVAVWGGGRWWIAQRSGTDEATLAAGDARWAVLVAVAEAPPPPSPRSADAARWVAALAEEVAGWRDQRWGDRSRAEVLRGLWAEFEASPVGLHGVDLEAVTDGLPAELPAELDAAEALLLEAPPAPDVVWALGEWIAGLPVAPAASAPTPRAHAQSVHAAPDAADVGPASGPHATGIPEDARILADLVSVLVARVTEDRRAELRRVWAWQREHGRSATPPEAGRVERVAEPRRSDVLLAAARVVHAFAACGRGPLDLGEAALRTLLDDCWHELLEEDDATFRARLAHELPTDAALLRAARREAWLVMTETEPAGAAPPRVRRIARGRVARRLDALPRDILTKIWWRPPPSWADAVFAADSAAADIIADNVLMLAVTLNPLFELRRDLAEAERRAGR